MSAVTLFLVLIGVVVCSANYVIDCNDGGFFHRTDPESCSHFYKCDHGEPVRFSCPDGTLYNRDTYNCDWPGNVDCGTRPIGHDGERSNNEDNDVKTNNNIDDNNGNTYNNDNCYNNGDDNYGNTNNNGECYNNRYDNNGNNNDDTYWKQTDQGTFVNPYQTDWGPNDDIPASAIEAAAESQGKPTIDDAYQDDYYYNSRRGPIIDIRK